MKANAELEFINKVRNLQKSMLDLALFWEKNQEALEDVNEYEDYPFHKSFGELTVDNYNWYLKLKANYCENLQKNK